MNIKIGVLSLVIITASVVSCSQIREPDKVERKVDSSNYVGDTLVFDEKYLFDSYFDTLQNSLNRNAVPNFLLDECLDANEAAYTDLGSSKSRSLRYDLIKHLPINQLQLLSKLSANNQNLNKVCNLSYMKEKLHAEHSTNSLIKLILLEVHDKK